MAIAVSPYMEIHLVGPRKLPISQPRTIWIKNLLLGFENPSWLDDSIIGMQQVINQFNTHGNMRIHQLLFGNLNLLDD